MTKHVFGRIYEMERGTLTRTCADPVWAVFEAIGHAEEHRVALAGSPVIVAIGDAEAPQTIADGDELTELGFRTRSITTHERDGRWFTTLGPWTGPS